MSESESESESELQGNRSSGSLSLDFSDWSSKARISSGAQTLQRTMTVSKK